ncbi:MAG: polysaccharide biosynthesis/export family protein [Verrucomicrobia bacterium]|nr:polysaccharide biosynthesis/export family protein [Verrucomicrobiota bacterium]
MKAWLSFSVIVLAGAGALAQGTPPTSSATRDASGFLIVPATAPIKASPTNMLPSPSATTGNGYVNDDKHKLIAGDKVSFQILEDRSLPVALQVTESTELDIPYIGRVSVEGKTCKQLADDMKVLLEQDYYKRATIIIGLDAMAKVIGRIYVWGPVRNQGPIEIPANETFTAGKAILRAGGFGDFANKKEVKVIRKTPRGNVTLKVNLVEVLEKGKTDQDIVLEPEDFIIVSQRAINF